MTFTRAAVKVMRCTGCHLFGCGSQPRDRDGPLDLVRARTSPGGGAVLSVRRRRDGATLTGGLTQDIRTRYSSTSWAEIIDCDGYFPVAEIVYGVLKCF